MITILSCDNNRKKKENHELRSSLHLTACVHFKEQEKSGHWLAKVHMAMISLLFSANEWPSFSHLTFQNVNKEKIEEAGSH